jgi:hypothetical protein
MMSDPLTQALEQLQPIHPPAAISWWPPAPGWWLLLLLLLALLWLGWHSHTMRRPQRAALRRLREIQRGPLSTTQQLAALNQLLKRYLISSGAQPQHAPLSGEAWLRFLDRHSHKPGFLDAPGALLLSTPYQPDSTAAEPQQERVESLFRLSRHWIRHNTPRRLQL